MNRRVLGWRDQTRAAGRAGELSGLHAQAPQRNRITPAPPSCCTRATARAAVAAHNACNGCLRAIWQQSGRWVEFQRRCMAWARRCNRQLAQQYGMIEQAPLRAGGQIAATVAVSGAAPAGKTVPTIRLSTSWSADRLTHSTCCSAPRTLSLLVCLHRVAIFPTGASPVEVPADIDFPFHVAGGNGSWAQTW